MSSESQTATNITYAAYSTTTSGTYQFYTNDASGIIFEFTAINASNKFDVLPRFERSTLTTGFGAVNAVARINVNASTLSNLFYFQGFNLSTSVAPLPVYYGINKNFTFNETYSNASVLTGYIDASPANAPLLKQDYVNYLAYAITGGYSLATIFANETELMAGVATLDSSFNNNMNASISTVTNYGYTNFSKTITVGNTPVFFDTSDNRSPLIQGCKVLVDGLLSIAGTTRGQQFLSDIQAQDNISPNDNSSSTLVSYYNVSFQRGDILSVLLNYQPYNSTNGASIAIPNLGTNLVSNRSYKIMFYAV
jgi:hypothetical protein